MRAQEDALRGRSAEAGTQDDHCGHRRIARRKPGVDGIGIRGDDFIPVLIADEKVPLAGRVDGAVPDEVDDIRPEALHVGLDPVCVGVAKDALMDAPAGAFQTVEHAHDLRTRTNFFVRQITVHDEKDPRREIYGARLAGRAPHHPRHRHLEILLRTEATPREEALRRLHHLPIEPMQGLLTGRPRERESKKRVFPEEASASCRISAQSWGPSSVRHR